MDELNWYLVTCRNEKCKYKDVTARCLGPEGMTFMCGPCGEIIDDWCISNDSQ